MQSNNNLLECFLRAVGHTDVDQCKRAILAKLERIDGDIRSVSSAASAVTAVNRQAQQVRLRLLRSARANIANTANLLTSVLVVTQVTRQLSSALHRTMTDALEAYAIMRRILSHDDADDEDKRRLRGIVGHLETRLKALRERSDLF